MGPGKNWTITRCWPRFCAIRKHGETASEARKEPSAAGERIVRSLIEKNFATVGELKAELGAVVDEDTIKSTLADLLDDCWIEVVRGSGSARAMGKVSFGKLVNSLDGTTLPTSEFIGAAKEISFAEIICPNGGSIEESDFARHFRAKQMLQSQERIEAGSSIFCQLADDQ